MPAVRRLASMLAADVVGYSRLMGPGEEGMHQRLKAYRREVIEGVRLYGEMHRFLPIYASWHGAKIEEVEVRHYARKSGAGKRVVLFGDGHSGASIEFPAFGVGFVALLLQHVQVGDGDRHLGFHLHKLVFHVEDDLLDHRFGIFSPVDEVVEIGTKQRADAF